MEYSVVSSAEFTYPDRFQYASSSGSMDVFAARGGYACCQLLLRGLEKPHIEVGFGSLPEGVTPEIWRSNNIPGCDEHNKPIHDKYRHRIHHLYPVW